MTEQLKFESKVKVAWSHQGPNFDSFDCGFGKRPWGLAFGAIWFGADPNFNLGGSDSGPGPRECLKWNPKAGTEFVYTRHYEAREDRRCMPYFPRMLASESNQQSIVQEFHECRK